MPYLWTRPRRKRAYGAAIWLLYLAVIGAVWGVVRESWISYSQVPFFDQMMLPPGSGRLTTILGLQSYLTIDRDMVDPTGAAVQGAEPVVQRTWNQRGLVWSVAYTLGGAVAAYVLVRVLTCSRRLKGRCDECGYDLTGLESARCPECGTAVASGGDPR